MYKKVEIKWVIIWTRSKTKPRKDRMNCNEHIFFGTAHFSLSMDTTVKS